jgi:PIN domain nuclease of toxin-antitoxin system
VRALLDTHTFLWWNMDDPQLSPAARNFIIDGRNELYFSAACAWEIAIKAGRGKLLLPEPPEKYVAERLALHHIQALPIQLSHALRVFMLPELHRDPVDRLLVVQSQMEGLPILTADGNIRRYAVETIW